MLDVTLFWSFRSPYSYVVLPRMIELQRSSNVRVDLRVIHPNAIRVEGYFERMHPLARPYFLRDSARAAAFHGLPFCRPEPDPIAQDPVTLKVAAEQPLARYLSRLGIAACMRGLGLEFARQISHLLWSGEVARWNEGPHMAEATARAGLDLAALEADVAGLDDHFESQLAANDQMLKEFGHWGAPTMVFNGEPFFGQDRFDMLVWRLGENGLEWVGERGAAIC